MTTLIINADDFGYSKGVNYGIGEAHLSGAVTSATLMANMPDMLHAVRLKETLPELGVGIHLSLTLGKPVSSHVDRLVGEDGTFRSRAYYQTHHADLDQLYEEWKAQIGKVLAAGIRLTHLDSHHHVHALKEHAPVTERLSEEFSLPVRPHKDVAVQQRNSPSDVFWDLFSGSPIRDAARPYSQVKAEALALLEKELANHAGYSVVEAGCHPGYVDAEVHEGSSYHLPRMREVALLTSAEFQSLIKEYGFVLSHYGELA